MEINIGLNKGVIYVVNNNVNGKVYVGQAKNYVKAKDIFIKHGSHRRWTQHVWEANFRPEGGCDYLNKAIVKHTEFAFTVQDVHECLIEELNDWEIYFIAEYNANNPMYGYNLTPGGESYIRSSETIEKCSIGQKNLARKKAEEKDRNRVVKLSKLDISSISIRITDTTTRKRALIKIIHSTGITEPEIYALDTLKDAIERAYNISLQLIDKDKITLSKRTSNILFGDIHDMRETP